MLENNRKKTENISIESFEKRELKPDGLPSFDYVSVVTLNDDKGIDNIDTHVIDRNLVFNQNLLYWNKATNVLSVNNYENGYFKSIVGMGKEAVPMIYEELKKGPTPLVHALDLIFPGVVEYNGFVSLKESCDTWISILKKTRKYS